MTRHTLRPGSGAIRLVRDTPHVADLVSGYHEPHQGGRFIRAELAPRPGLAPPQPDVPIIDLASEKRDLRDEVKLLQWVSAGLLYVGALGWLLYLTGG